MHDKKLLRAKSYTSIYDIFGPHSFNNVLYRNPNKVNTDVSVYQATCGDTDIKDSEEHDPTVYVTSERYHFLNRDISYSSIVKSTSTIFYDLDEIARRQSFHCFVQISPSKEKLYRNKERSVNGFQGKSNIIVQECATQIRQKSLPRDSIVINSKKVKHRKFPNDLVLSSEIFLRDNEYELYNQNRYYDREITDRQQKFWSYAKYRTEYTRPIPEEKKSKKKDRGKRTEDPCPCQLFSYACPCTDKKKSLTELAKNSKSLTVTEKVTSTLNISPDEPKVGKSNWKTYKQDTVRVCKVTNTSFDKNNHIEVKFPNTDKHEVSKAPEKNLSDKNANQKQVKNMKKKRQIICPNCKEKVEIMSSTEDEEGSKTMGFNPNEITPTAAYTYKSGVQKPPTTSTIDEDCCNHEPRCELVPVCQLLPENFTTKCPKKQPIKPPNPRVIRITKACRHHPPCTVVPSCQRATVLKNNCEYIPPCLHRPRCVNLPLCVPDSKTFNIDDFTHIDTMDSPDCPHIPKCRYVPECQNDSINGSTTHQFNTVPQIQNACEFVNKYHFKLPETTCMLNAHSPCGIVPPMGCGCSKSTKSCQYNCSDCKCNILKESASDAIIFIRDVGCQFRNKYYSPKDSLVRSKTSSVSFDYLDGKMGNYFTDTHIHTLRCEDKYTSPLSRGDLYDSSASISSTEIDSNCPSHGHRATRTRPTGFVPKETSPFVAYNTQNDVTSYPASRTEKDKDSVMYVDAGDTLPEKMSCRSFLKGKCKKMFAVKRRRNYRASSHVMSCCSRKVICRPNAV